MKRVLCFMAFAVLAIFSLAIVSCGNDNEDLGGGYTYYFEQKMIDGKYQIPPTILEYKYNPDIIIVKQRPTKYRDIMYIDYNYPLGRDTIYYWIIEKKTNTLTGPVNYDEFLKEISKYDEYECLSKCKATKISSPSK